jgi:hypothetical protein
MKKPTQITTRRIGAELKRRIIKAAPTQAERKARAEWFRKHVKVEVIR